MSTKKNTLNEKEMELVKYLVSDCRTTGDIQEKLKRLFAGTIEQMLEAEMEEHLGYEKHSIAEVDDACEELGACVCAVLDLL